MSKLSSEFSSLIAIVNVDRMVPSMMLSSTPVMITVCGVFQLLPSNVRISVAVASPSSSVVMENSTVESGSASRTTVTLSVVPSSATSVELSLSTTVKPGVSSSVVEADTAWSATLSNSSSELLASTAMEIVDDTVPSIRKSSVPVTVTVCGVSQLAFVKVRGVLTVVSPVSSEVIVRTTSDVG